MTAVFSAVTAAITAAAAIMAVAVTTAAVAKVQKRKPLLLQGLSP